MRLCCVVLCLQVLPANGKLYHAIRQGKVSMLPTYSVTFQNLIKVRQGMRCEQSVSVKVDRLSAASMASAFLLVTCWWRIKCMSRQHVQETGEGGVCLSKLHQAASRPCLMTWWH